MGIVAETLVAVLLSAPGFLMAGFSIGREKGRKSTLEILGIDPEGRS